LLLLEKQICGILSSENQQQFRETTPGTRCRARAGLNAEVCDATKFNAQVTGGPI